MAQGDIDPRPHNRLVNFILSDAFWTGTWRLFVLVLILLATFFTGYAILRGGITTTDVANGEFMRGLITTLLLVGTLVLVVTVILSTLFSSDDDSTLKRVSLAREVLSPLFGILGTIVGFYFGSQIAERPKAGVQPQSQAPVPGAVVPGAPIPGAPIPGPVDASKNRPGESTQPVEPLRPNESRKEAGQPKAGDSPDASRP